MVFPQNLNTLLVYVNYVLFILNQAKNTTNHFLQVICQDLRTPLKFLILLFQLINTKHVLRCFTVLFLFSFYPAWQTHEGETDCSQARRHVGAFQGHAPKSLLVPPEREFCSPSEDCAPKKLKGSVLLESNSRPKTPWLSLQNSWARTVFFIDFAIKTVCFSGFTPKFTQTRVYCGIKTSFFLVFTYFLRWRPYFFWSSPKNSRKFSRFFCDKVQNLWNFADFLRWRSFFFLFWSLPQISSNFALNTNFFWSTHSNCKK